MKRRILATALAAALLVFALSAIAQAVRHKTSIFANYSGGSTSGYVFGSLNSPYLKCKKARSVTARYTATSGEQVSVSDKTDSLGYFRMPPTGNLPTVAAGDVTVTVKKKRAAPFDEKHICKKKTGIATPTQYRPASG